MKRAPKTSTILAIDPGYERLGIAILDRAALERDRLIYSECFRTSAKDPHAERLAQIQKRITEIVEEFTPTELAIEDLFFNTNQKTALRVAEARGAIIATAKNSGLEIFEYKPQEIKVAVTGDGRSDKTAIAKMIPLLVNLEKIAVKKQNCLDSKNQNLHNSKIQSRLDDEYDAIACGLTHIATSK